MYFNNERLLAPPVNRAAFSDRTAWIMAEMSRLAYFKFEGSQDLDELAQSLLGKTDKGEIQKALKILLGEKQQNTIEAKDQLNFFLENGNFKLVATFDVNGTQAFLAASDVYHILVLVFRGTESIEDVKTDLKAAMMEVEGYKVHSGFYKAFSLVRSDLEAALKQFSDQNYALYITGHSLGGALALLATKFLAFDSAGACYTFGSPRVASTTFGDDIKTPIYRLVNAADTVPRVPPTYILNLLIGLCWFIPVPYLRKFLLKQLNKMKGYSHHGDMRYLTATKESDYSDLRLIQNPGGFDRFIRYVQRFLFDKKSIATDHFIANYCNKLEAYALRRNTKLL